MTKQNKILVIIGAIFIVIVGLAWFGLRSYQDSIEQKELTKNVSCDDTTSSKITSWQDFTGSNGRYAVKFPKGDGSTGATETTQNISEDIGGVSGVNDTLVLVTSFETPETYSVSHHLFPQQPSISEIEKYMGANKICSKPGETYEGYPMTDFFEVSKSSIDSKLLYSRYRIVQNGKEFYELKMNSDTPQFNGYSDFVNSFHLSN